MADTQGFPIIAPVSLDYSTTGVAATADSRLQFTLLQAMHRLSAVAVLVLVGGMALAYKERERTGAGSTVFAVGLLIALLATAAGCWASQRAASVGQRWRGRRGMKFCTLLLWATALLLLADQVGWLQALANAVHEQFERLSTQDVAISRPRRS